MNQTLPVQSGMHDAFREFLDPTESLSEGLWQSSPILTTNGKTWVLKYKGQDYTFMGQLASGQQVPMPHVDLVILRQTGWLTKTFYDGPYDPIQSAGKRPDCASDYGDFPNPDVPNPQAQSCAQCSRNVFKLRADGRKGKECSDSKKMAVLLLPEDTERLLGFALTEPVMFRVPPASLGDLNRYGNELKGMGKHFAAVLTHIEFDPGEKHQQMVFSHLQDLGPEFAPTIREYYQSPAALRITGEDVSPENRRLRYSPQTAQGATAAAPAVQQGPVTIDVPAKAVAQAQAARRLVPHPNQGMGAQGTAAPQPPLPPRGTAAPRPVGPAIVRPGNGARAPAPQTGPVSAQEIPGFLRRDPVGPVGHAQAVQQQARPAPQAQPAEPEQTTIDATDAAIDDAIGNIMSQIRK